MVALPPFDAGAAGDAPAITPYRRVHHQRIAFLLQAFDPGLLNEARCYFGGGTAIALMLDEFRESVDIDFLCSSRDGFRRLRETVGKDLGALLRYHVPHAREVVSNQNKILTFLEVDGVKVKIEIIHEGNTDLEGGMDARFPVPVLSRTDLWAQKLMANADRAADKHTFSRDILDLGMMLHAWGPLPNEAFQKAQAAYGRSVVRGFHHAMRMIADPAHLRLCLDKLCIDPELRSPLLMALDDASACLPMSVAEQEAWQKRTDDLQSAESRGGLDGAFERLAKQAMVCQGGEDRASVVNWSQVERDFICHGLANGFLPEQIAAVIAQRSPAVVNEDRMKTVERRIFFDSGAFDWMGSADHEREVEGPNA